MKRYVGLVCAVAAAVLALSLAGCSSPEQKAAKEAFNVEKARIEGQVEDLNELAASAEVLADSSDKALDEELRPALRQAAKDAYNTASSTKIPSMKSKVEDIEVQTAELQGIDLSPDIEKIKTATKALEDSMKKYKLVDNPSEEYVLTCLRRIPCLDKVVALTEETDPTDEIGKPGRYTGKIVAHSVNVEHYTYDEGLRTLEEIGNPAGGCVEIFSNEDDANKRDEEMEAMEGTIKSPGAHKVIGTVLLRASESQKTSDMNALIESMEEELTRLGDGE